jgi:hypothetical protein
MNSEEIILSLRPQLNLVEQSEDNGVVHFQNKTLRPLLKLLNDKILSITQEKLPKLGNIAHLEERRKYIHQIFDKNPGVTHLLIGMIIGLMTMQELHYYLSNQNEINRRIKGMIIERIASQMTMPSI